MTNLILDLFRLTIIVEKIEKCSSGGGRAVRIVEQFLEGKTLVLPFL